MSTSKSQPKMKINVKLRLVMAAILFLTLSMSAVAQLNVGSTAQPNADAILQLTSTTKGLLLPQVALTSTNSAAPLSAHVAGMVVYNTATSGSGATAVTPGIYANDGAKWNQMTTQSSTPAASFTGGTLTCAGTQSGTYQPNVAMTSSNTKVITITVATAGNYSATTTTVNGVSFSASGTILSTGPINFTLTASGTPTATGAFAYPISFGGQSCTFNVAFGCQNDISAGSGTIIQMAYDNTGSGSANYSWCARTVVGPDGLTWLDRNLGAYQVAISSSDAASYGSLYQWGRNGDGHQLVGTGRGVDNVSSATTATQATTNTPGNVGFITVNADWRSDNNNNRWNNITGSGSTLVQENNPCPSGYHVPTSAQQVTLSSSWTNAANAYASTLKLPVASYRGTGDGSLGIAGVGYYWSSTPGGTDSYMLYFNGSSVTNATNGRGNGFAVRCIKN